ncbi:MAG TPA: nucleotidyltransferase family protein [Thermomicrobiales bacterium]|nr:nucleotidyltransferase family protein [Thermomicrobiales bacterium]
MSRIAGIVLAAGLSRRLGRPKQLLELDGRPLVAHVVARAALSSLDEVLVVTGAHAGAIADALEGFRVRIVHNDRYEAGQGTSLAAGIAALAEDVDAAVILLADQPAVLTSAIDLAIGARRVTRSPIVMARYGEQRGHPVLFGRELFPELLQLDGDAGGREIIRAHQADVVLVDGGACAPPADVDTEDAWVALRESWDQSFQ